MLNLRWEMFEVEGHNHANLLIIKYIYCVIVLWVCQMLYMECWKNKS